MPAGDFPQGFVLSEAAQYAFLCQDVYGDIVSFAHAIPDHLKQLFLIPVKLEVITASETVERIAPRTADGPGPSGNTDDSDLFGTKTFTYDDVEPTIPQSDDGSIFDIDGADAITHHQEYNFDENIQAPSDTSYMSDVDVTQYWDYPYRTKEQPVRHSFTLRQAGSALASLSGPEARKFRRASASIPAVLFSRIAIKPEALVPRTPQKIKKNAASCVVGLTSYDKKGKVFTFSVTGGKAPRTVQAFLSNIDQVALSCNCPFWRWNGPEFHAKSEDYMLGKPFGTAAPPDVRDPDRKYFLCKHAYAVLKRLDGFVNEVVDENWDLSDEDLMKQVDEEWDRLSVAAQVPLDELEKDDVDLQVDWSGIPGAVELEVVPAEEPVEPESAEELVAPAEEPEEYETPAEEPEAEHEVLPEPEEYEAPLEEEPEEEYEAPLEEESEEEYEAPLEEEPGQEK